MKIDFKYDLENIRQLRQTQRLFYSSNKYLGDRTFEPEIITTIKNILESGIELTRQEQRQLKFETQRIKRLSSPYYRVRERELSKIAIEDFVKSLDMQAGMNKTQQINIERIKQKVLNFNQKQRDTFLKHYYQDPKTVTARTTTEKGSPTPEQKMRKAYGKNGYMVQRVLDAEAEIIPF